MPRLLRKSVVGLGEAEASTIQTGIDVIGDLAIVKFPKLSDTAKRRVGETILKEMKNVSGVFEQEGGIEGEYRLRRLRHVAGERRTVTLHRENQCSFKVDIARVYYSPRLSTERLRVATMVSQGESVLNMFAGVGPFSITIARRRRARVTSCEANRYAYELHLENNQLNKVADRIRTMNVDAATLPSDLSEKFDRILMPHPSRADRYLRTALDLIADKGVIHYYRHVPGMNFEEAKASLLNELAGIAGLSSVNIRRVREVGPRWLELVADIQTARS